MKTKYFYCLLAIIATCFLACKNEDNTNPSSISKQYVHAYDYGDSESFQEFYNQIYAIADLVQEDDELLSLVSNFEYDWEDEEDENYNKYDEHPDYYTNLAYIVSQTITSQELDNIIDQFMGRPIESQEREYEGHLAYMYSLMQEVGYVTDSILYNILNVTNVSESEIPLLCTAYAFYNHMMEETIIRQLILDDGVTRYPYAFPMYDYPQYDSPFTIWTAEITSLDYVLNSVDSLPKWIRQHALIRDSICFSNSVDVRIYLLQLVTTGTFEVTAMECQENWQRDYDEATEQYKREIQCIINSQLSPKAKQAILLLATTQMKVKKDLADHNYDLCKRAAQNEN